MTTRILTSIQEVTPQQWSALGPESTFVEHGYLTALEVSGSLAHNAMEPRHVTLWDGERLVAALPAFLKRGEELDHLPDWVARVARKNDLPYDPTLFIGVPFVRAPGRKFLTAAGIDRAAAMTTVIAAAQDTVRALPTPVIHYYFTTEDEVALLAPSGFHARISPRAAWRNASYGSFDDFLAALTGRRARAIRGDRRAVQDQSIEIVRVPGSEVTSEQLDLFWTYYQRTVEKYQRTGDRVTRAYFTQLCELLPEAVELVLVRRADEVIATKFDLTSRDTLYPMFWGGRGDFGELLFELVYTDMETAIARKLAAIDLGGTMEYQLLRGFVPVGYDHSASWVGDEDLDEALARLIAKEREWMPRDVEQKLARSPYRKTDPATT